MQSLRKWRPEPAIRTRAGTAPNLSHVSRADLGFCRRFAVHGGIARSMDGFKAETELVRMQKAGLLILERDKAPPFAVVQVALSPAAREKIAASAPNAVSADDIVRPSRPPGDASGLEQCRKGFEVARSLIGAVVRDEFARAESEPNHAIEQRILERIGALQGPFG